jgi:hypothetical protein
MWLKLAKIERFKNFFRLFSRFAGSGTKWSQIYWLVEGARGPKLICLFVFRNLHALGNPKSVTFFLQALMG